MKVSFEDSLSVELQDKVVLFLVKNGACIEQFPQWETINNRSGTRKFFIAYNSNDELLAFCIVYEIGRLVKRALINFGPVVSGEVSYFEILSEVIEFYSGQGYASIVVRLAEPVGAKTEMLSYLLHKNYTIKELYDKDFNWTSLKISLESSIDEIVKKFSKGHRSAIKRAQKEGLEVEHATPETLCQFGEIYYEMYLQRGKVLDKGSVLREFTQIHNLFKEFSLGEILVVKNGLGEIIGGIMIVFQGSQARYFRGASNPKMRNHPILHLGIYEAICLSKNKDMFTFDLWGYNHLVDDSDQRYQINKFKKGFTDDFVFYAKPIEVVLSRGKHGLHRLISLVKSKLN